MTRKAIAGWISGSLFSALLLASLVHFHQHASFGRACHVVASRCREVVAQTIQVEPNGLIWSGMASALLLSGLLLLWFGGSRR